MNPTKKGKFCNSCQKEVVDFTSASAYTLACLLDTNQNICGRFSSSQLNKEFNSNTNKRFQRSGLALGITSLLSLCTPVIGQEVTNRIETVSKLGKPMLSQEISTDSTGTKPVGGIVLDPDNLPLPGANVAIEGMGIGTQTDFDGNYSLNIPTDWFSKDIELTISYVGFETKKIPLKEMGTSTILQWSEYQLQEVIITGMVIVKRRSIFRKIGDLFRRKKPKIAKENYQDATNLIEAQASEMVKEVPEKTSLIVWPNPIIREVNLAFTMESEGEYLVHLTPINQTYKKVLISKGLKNKGRQELTIFTDTVKNGTYVLTITTQEKVEHHKVIVNKG